MSTRSSSASATPAPGTAKTRHNAGWQILDLLAERHGAPFKRTRLLHGEAADVRVGGVRVRMVEPHSFMNLCGPVYRRALAGLRASTPPEALVVVDDFALPFGRLRLRAEGSAGRPQRPEVDPGAPSAGPPTPGCGWGSGPCPRARTPPTTS